MEWSADKKSFDLLHALPIENIPVILITAHPERDVRAFEVDAIRLSTQARRPPKAQTKPQEGFWGSDQTKIVHSHDTKKILFRDDTKNILLRVGDIQVLEASEAYTRLVLGDGRGITINGTLKGVRDRLDPKLFFSASRSHAINLDHVANVEDIEGGFMILTMANGVKVELSRRHSGEFRRLKSV